MKYVLLIIGSYLIGSIPFGLIIAKAYGKDLRAIGSGNIGATNLSRALGRNWGYICFLLDVLKGFIPMLVADNIVSDELGMAEWFICLGTGCAAILGHVYPIFAGFKGGKGVATSFGVAMGLWPYYTISATAALIVWAAVVLISHYISLASIVAALVFPITLIAAIAIKPEWNFLQLWPLLIVAVAIPILVIIKHKKNISRLIAGTENKVLNKKNSNGGK